MLLALAPDRFGLDIFMGNFYGHGRNPVFLSDLI